MITKKESLLRYDLEALSSNFALFTRFSTVLKNEIASGSKPLIRNMSPS